MRDDFFVLMYLSGVTTNEKSLTAFERYHDVKDVEDVVQTWLTTHMDLECCPEEKEAEVRAANGGELPEDVFICPTVERPEDLSRYNGYYDLGGLGRIFDVFLTPIHDAAAARRFRAEMDKEYGISQTWSESADRMMEHLNTFVDAFEDNSIDDTAAEAAIREFILRGGFSLFDAPDWTS